MWACGSFSCIQGTAVQQKSNTPITKEQEEEDDDDDIDLFGSDDDEEAEKLKEERLKEYAEKKAKKPALIAKSSILLDVKPVSYLYLLKTETDILKGDTYLHTLQELRNMFSGGSKNSLFLPGHFTPHEKFKCKTPGKSS